MSHQPRIGRTTRTPSGTRRPLRRPASPLVAAGTTLTITGAALYTTLGERPGLVAAGALILGAIAAWRCASRQG
ncbi:hypothetical protein ACFVJ8_05840 [Streptomyces yangpuensis]|uniref:hypothetical protein n=1 Tax=Streptomyces TaxID=1883 RepID=UPI0004C8C0D8|nr:hypothetical protein [Streptomyces sp. NRRL S-378]